MPLVLPPRWSVLLASTLLAPAVLAGCASAVDGTAVADPRATTTTTTAQPTTEATTTAPTEETTTRAAPPAGSATLDDPTITTAKSVPTDGQPFCDLVTPADIATAFGLTLQDTSVLILCSITFAEGGSVYVSSAGDQVRGTPIEIGGNSAIYTEGGDGPGSCQVTVALSAAGALGDLLDIDVRDVSSPARPLCDGARDLARIVFDKLPDA